MTLVNEIRLGDCIQGMLELEDRSVDLIVADPPYNLGKDYDNDSDKQEWCDYVAWTNQWLYQSYRILKNTGSIYVFMGTEFVARLFIMMQYQEFKFNSWIVWHYTQGVGRIKGFSPRHEDILFFTKTEDFRFSLSSIRQPQKASRSVNNPLGANPGDVWSIPHIHHNKGERTPHPTQKPEAVIERIIQASSFPGDLVVDPFSGSGTTAAVCKRTSRNFIGWEINPDFHRDSKLRLLQ